MEVEEILHARMADAHGGEAEKWNVESTAHGIYAEPKELFEALESSAKPFFSTDFAIFCPFSKGFRGVFG